jgi:hypothetical protein
MAVLGLADRAGCTETERMGQDDKGVADQRTAFSNLPGTHVHNRRVGGTKHEYVRGDGTVLAARRTHWQRNPLYPNPRVTVSGRVFEERLLGKRRNNHMRSPREVIDLETGTRLFRIDGLNFRVEANTVIRFSESRWYSLPVEGTMRNYPVMTAVDNEGRVALQFADTTRHLEAGEIVMPPDQPITLELLVMMATASSFLVFFFLKPHT